MSVAIHEMLNDGGFSAEIRLAPWGALVDDVFAGNFDMFLVSRGHLIDAYDPEGYLSADFSCETVGQSNYANYCNPEVDGLLEQARLAGRIWKRGMKSIARFSRYFTTTRLARSSTTRSRSSHTAITCSTGSRICSSTTC